MTNSTPDDVIWAPTEASKPGLGLSPQAESSKAVRQVSCLPRISAQARAGQAILAGKASLTDSDLEALTVFRRAV